MMNAKTRNTNYILTAICVLAFTATRAQEIQKRQISPAQIDAVFSQWDTPDTPGIAVGVLNDGEIVYTKGYGLANLEHRIPITPETRFHIGDLAKEFTVYALLLLEHRGQLSLQDDVRAHMAQLRSFPKPIRIQQLLHHTAGLNNEEVAKALAGWRTDDVLTKKQAYEMIKRQARSLAEGASVQRFSDAGFMILEDLIAKISNRPYTEFIEQEIFRPLGMNNSKYDTYGAVIANKAQGYYAQNDGFITATMNPGHTLVSDLYTTVGDLCLWAKELRSPKIGTPQMLRKFDGLSVVDGKEVAQENTALYTGSHRYWNFRGAKKLYHIEVAGGYASKLIRYPEYDLAVVIMGNDGAYNGYAGTGASALYIEDFLEDAVDEVAEIKAKKLTKKQLMAFTGMYWDATNHSTRKIHMVNDTLRYFRGPGNESALVPLSKNSFKMITRGAVEVQFNSNATPKTMTVSVGADTFDLIAFDPTADWAADLGEFTGDFFAETLGTTYSLTVDNGKLVLTHPRIETVTLEPRIPDQFAGDRRHFSAFAFKRNTQGAIEGFELATFGVEPIRFKKVASARMQAMKTR